MRVRLHTTTGEAHTELLRVCNSSFAISPFLFHVQSLASNFSQRISTDLRALTGLLQGLPRHESSDRCSQTSHFTVESPETWLRGAGHWRQRLLKPTLKLLKPEGTLSHRVPGLLEQYCILVQTITPVRASKMAIDCLAIRKWESAHPAPVRVALCASNMVAAIGLVGGCLAARAALGATFSELPLCVLLFSFDLVLVLPAGLGEVILDFASRAVDCQALWADDLVEPL